MAKKIWQNGFFWMFFFEKQSRRRFLTESLTDIQAIISYSDTNHVWGAEKVVMKENGVMGGLGLWTCPFP